MQISFSYKKVNNLFFKLVRIIFCAVFLFFGFNANAASLYYNAAVNTSWGTLGNWWQDSAYTVPATALPGAGDDVYIYGHVITSAASATTVQNITVGTTTPSYRLVGTNLTATGLITLNASSYLSVSITGNVLLNDSSYFSNDMIIYGNTTFNTNYWGAVPTGGTYTITRCETRFQVMENWYGSDNQKITNIILNGGACTRSSLRFTGDVTLNNTSYIRSCVFNGTVTFNDSSRISNAGGWASISGNIIFNGNSSEKQVAIGGTNTLTRRYTSDIDASARDFTLLGDSWKVLADGAIVTMTDPTKYNSTTDFQVANGGSFVGPTISVPTVTSSSTVDSILQTSATLNGNVTATGGSSATEHGFAYGTDPTLSTVIATTTGGTLTGANAFSSSSARSISGLSAGTTYYYRAYATNLAGIGYGEIKSFYTLANAPSAPTLSSPSSTSITLILDTNNGVSTNYAIYNKTQDQYLQADGTLGNSAVWQTYSLWGSTSGAITTGLLENTQYTYQTKARNGNNIETASSTDVSRYTLAPTPTNLSATADAISITLSVDALPNATAGSSGYYFSNTTNGTNSGWIQTNSWQNTGLSCGVSYDYSVKYRNGDGTETSSISITKSANPCGGGSFGGSVGGSVSAGGLNSTVPAPRYQTVYPDGRVVYLDGKTDNKKQTTDNQQPTTDNQQLTTITTTNTSSAVASTAEQNPLVSFALSAPSSFPTFTKPVSVGTQSSDVKALQTFLASDKTLYPEGLITGYFGPLTKSAVLQFQLKYEIVSSPKDPGAGNFGPKTRGKVNEVMGRIER